MLFCYYIVVVVVWWLVASVIIEIYDEISYSLKNRVYRRITNNYNTHIYKK